jgi:GNAT superfamily N-acetyltransferase
MAVAIRAYRPEDTGAVRRCVVALQEYERHLDPRLRPGEEMADAYWENIQQRCRDANGQVFVADDGGVVVGFVSVLAAEPFVEPDDPIGPHALVTDVVVLPSHRGQRIGARLLERAEAFARDAGATELRIAVLADNVAARRLYLSEGFAPYLEVFVKPL